METRDPIQAAQEALAFEGYENVSADFDLSRVDAVTRWVAAVAMEKALGQKFPDEHIQEADTLADLL